MVAAPLTGMFPVLVAVVAAEVLPVVWRAEVEAPAGSGSDVLETGTTWSLAMFTGVELAVTAAPLAGILAVFVPMVPISVLMCRSLAETVPAAPVATAASASEP